MASARTGAQRRLLLRAATIALVTGLAALAEGAQWSRAYIRALPDAAFASVEVRPDGTKVRHLPHHDHEGNLDPSHLRSALSRLHQVKWLDPAEKARALRHLQDHLRALRETRPNKGASPNRGRLDPVRAPSRLDVLAKHRRQG